MFKSKDKIINTSGVSVDISIVENNADSIKKEINEIKKIADDSNLSKRKLKPNEILFLFYCEKYSSNENVFPNFWEFRYGLNPEKTVKKLLKLNFIRISTAKESLENIKTNDLKEILRKKELKVSGKKSELIKRVSDSVTEEELSIIFPDRFYRLTELGNSEKTENEYVYIFEKPRYGFTLWEVNKLIGTKDPKRYMDYIWGDLNERYLKIIKSADFKLNPQLVCLVRRYMAEFLIDEKKYENAFLSLTECVFYDINYEAVSNYIYDKKQEKELEKFKKQGICIHVDKKNFSDYIYTHSKWFSKIYEEMNISVEYFKVKLVECFNNYKFKKTIFSVDELAEMIIYSIEENEDKFYELCKIAEKKINVK